MDGPFWTALSVVLSKRRAKKTSPATAKTAKIIKTGFKDSINKSMVLIKVYTEKQRRWESIRRQY